MRIKAVNWSVSFLQNGGSIIEGSYDEEVICLSSSDDDEISEVSRNDILPPLERRRKSSQSCQMLNGRSSNGSSVLRMSVKNEADKNEVILDDDDFEIETIREKLESVQKASADSDEEIQVLLEQENDSDLLLKNFLV
ncbi:hypothetical protein Ocin01_19381 [Orchesella cincta]|uniref:Uncharacterized protein n=1 Tax=Orchesella cincta TaxID=48709 RepID=A0A1D2M2Z2_ORCCI|nr:hypothetical protein Ocin01_19381 [Orchesella cincta]